MLDMPKAPRHGRRLHHLHLRLQNLPELGWLLLVWKLVVGLLALLALLALTLRKPRKKKKPAQLVYRCLAGQ